MLAATHLFRKQNECRPIIATSDRVLATRSYLSRYSTASPKPDFACAMTFSATRRSFVASASGVLALAASGCVPDVMAVGSVAQPAVAPPPGYDPVLLVVTNRSPVKGALRQPWYGHERNGSSHLARVVFARPDTTLTGRAQSVWNGEWTIRSVTPELRPVSQSLIDDVAGREVLLYTHGYKESFESAAVSAIALADGVAFKGKPLLFSWPSRAALFDYGYDRESALFSRDAFEETLVALLSDGGASRVHIVAHSMGTLLTIETLRQIWARHGDAMASRIGAVVLASADIDLDLFANALQRLRSLVPRITVISSTSDRALEVSRRMAGGVARTGAASREQLEGLGVRVVDASDYGGWAVVRHDLFLSDSDVRQVVSRAIERGQSG
jgi:esterase/lipase superfamily enzyme